MIQDKCKNGNCARLGNHVVRLNVGDRLLCNECIATFRNMGMSMRVLDEAPAAQPEWLRQATFARDLTGRVS